MAQEDRSDNGLTPEEKLANLVIRRKGLSPPVDVRSLAETYADVEEDFFPVAVDAVAIRRPFNHDRPLILINKRRANWHGRLRFTIAHEIGHVVIPFHPGFRACHVDASNVESQEDPSNAEARGIIALIEQGANLFASELLMPTEWVKSVISQEKIPRKKHQTDL